jgi:hypothetical protein
VSAVPPPSEPGALSLGAGGDALQRIFAPDGLLARALPGEGRDFEERAEQRQMAEAIASAIQDGSHLLVEAGTGTGKSYAYLIPFILWAVSQNKKVLIATHTKALQQQLVERDLPFCATCSCAAWAWSFASHCVLAPRTISARAV